MTDAHLELGGAIVIVAVSLVVVGFLAVKLLRPSRVPERLTFDGAPGVTVRPALGFEPGAEVVAMNPRTGELLRCRVPEKKIRVPLRPGQEPVRENFRHWLEGGPDYCG